MSYEFNLVPFDQDAIVRRQSFRIDRNTESVLKRCAANLRNLGLFPANEADLVRYAIHRLAVAAERAEPGQRYTAETFQVSVGAVAPSRPPEPF